MSLGFPLQDDIEIILYDILGNRSMVLTEVANVQLELQFQGVEELSFQMRAEDPRALYILSDGLIEYPTGTFWVNANFKDKNPSPVRTVKAKKLWHKLSWRQKPGVFSNLAKTPSEGFERILSGSGWTLGDNPAGDNELYTYEDIDSTVLKLLRAWAEVTGYELEFDTSTKEVHVRAAIGEAKDLGFYYGNNLFEIERTFEPPSVTRMYPYGANNLDITIVNPTGQLYIENYDWYMSTFGLTENQARSEFRKDYTWTDDRFLTETALYDAATAYLEQLSLPQISYAGKILDLSKLTDNLTDDIEVGDWVWIHDEVLDFHVQTRVVRLVRNPLRPQDDEVELEIFNNGLVQANENQAREIDYNAVRMIVDTNVDPVTVTSSINNYNSIALTSAGEALVAASGHFVGTATGTGTVEIAFEIDGVAYGDPVLIEFVDGQQVEHSWTTFADALTEGAHVLNWYAQVVSGTGTIALASEAGRAVVWTNGAVGVGVNATPNQFVSEEIIMPDPPTIVDSEQTITFYAAIERDVQESITVTPPTLLETWQMPFTIGDPVFGVLDGPGVLSKPDDNIYQYSPPPGGSEGGSDNYGPGPVTTPPFSPLDVGWGHAYWGGGPNMIAQGYSDGDPVTVWPDEVGGIDLSSGTDPVYRAAETTLDNQVAVDFVANDYMTQGSAMAAQETMVVIGYVKSTGTNRWHDNQAGGAGRWIMGVYTGNWQIYFGGTAGQSVAADTNPHLFVQRNSGANDRLDIDNNSIYGPGDYGSTTLTRLNINDSGSGGGVVIAFLGTYAGDPATDPEWSNFLDWVSSTFPSITIA